MRSVRARWGVRSFVLRCSMGGAGAPRAAGWAPNLFDELGNRVTGLAAARGSATARGHPDAGAARERRGKGRGWCEDLRARERVGGGGCGRRLRASVDDRDLWVCAVGRGWWGRRGRRERRGASQELPEEGRKLWVRARGHPGIPGRILRARGRASAVMRWRSAVPRTPWGRAAAKGARVKAFSHNRHSGWDDPWGPSASRALSLPCRFQAGRRAGAWGGREIGRCRAAGVVWGGVRMGLPEVMGWWERHACVGQSLGVTGLPLSASACSNGSKLKLPVLPSVTRSSWRLGGMGLSLGVRAEQGPAGACG